MAEAAHGAARGARQLEPPPPTGVKIDAGHGIFRVVAANPGPMTYHGTNTWFVPDGADGYAVIDPGPDDAAHLRATLEAGAGRISHVLVSHSHADHVGNARALSRALDVAVHGHARLAEHYSGPLSALRHGDAVAGLTVVHTPGHAQDHLCFARASGQVLFTADHVMGWSTSVVPPPPLGSARDYLTSLRMLLDRDDRTYLAGHGPPVTAPKTLVNTLLAQRLRRERDVRLLIEAEPMTLATLIRRIYPALKPGLDHAAMANVQGLLAKLAEDGAVIERVDGVWERA